MLKESENKNKLYPIQFLRILGKTSDSINENITIAPPIMRFGVKDSCKSIIPITAAITLSRESNTPLVVADTCFIPYSIKKKGKVVQNTVRYIN